MNGGPWARPVPIFVAGINAAAGALIVGSAVAASGESSLVSQIDRFAVAVGALIVAGATNAGLLITARRSMRIRRLALVGPEPLASVEDAVAIAVEQEPSVFVAAPGMTRYHRPTCLLAVGKDAAEATRAQHESAGRTPCGVCLS